MKGRSIQETHFIVTKVINTTLHQRKLSLEVDVIYIQMTSRCM